MADKELLEFLAEIAKAIKSLEHAEPPPHAFLTHSNQWSKRAALKALDEPAKQEVPDHSHTPHYWAARAKLDREYPRRHPAPETVRICYCPTCGRSLAPEVELAGHQRGRACLTCSHTVLMGGAQVIQKALIPE